MLEGVPSVCSRFSVVSAKPIAVPIGSSRVDKSNSSPLPMELAPLFACAANGDNFLPTLRLHVSTSFLMSAFSVLARSLKSLKFGNETSSNARSVLEEYIIHIPTSMGVDMSSIDLAERNSRCRLDTQIHCHPCVTISDFSFAMYAFISFCKRQIKYWQYSNADRKDTLASASGFVVSRSSENADVALELLKMSQMATVSTLPR